MSSTPVDARESRPTVEKEEAGQTGQAAGAAREPVAIVGIGCRVPGAHGPKQLWSLLRGGVDATREIPGTRWDLDAFFHPDPTVPGKMGVRSGGFLDRVDQFDAAFFGISPREALRLDPQHRFLLETSWEALEDAGIPPERLAGSKTGVFVGIATAEYYQRETRALRGIDMYSVTGSALSTASGRISYFFDFRGPNIALDTACSSSLVSVHLACESLWRGESTMALAGGVGLIIEPSSMITFTKLNALAPDAKCKAFDARANGYVRGEGVGLVVLKPLRQALADGDRVYAVIRGSAINQDGKTNGLTAPNRLAQEAVLKEAYASAGIAPSEAQYVEAHGTGTLLGDPIETFALGAVLGAGRAPEQALAIGSVKTNVGHLEAAAGVTGLIKLALMVRHGELVPSLHFEKPNPHIPFQKLGLRVQTARSPWPRPHRVGGVSAFGFSGTNAHLVVAEASTPARAEERPADPSVAPRVLTLSAKSAASLTALATELQGRLAAEPLSAMAFDDLVFNAQLRRSHLDHRLAVVAHTAEEASASLKALLQGDAAPRAFRGQRHGGRTPSITFVFCGQGGQTWGMGRRLLETEPVFRAKIEEIDALLRRDVSWSLVDELTADEQRSRILLDTGIGQPGLFAVQVALAELWKAWGVFPGAVIGHSVGEVAACCVAGVLPLPVATRVVLKRGQLTQEASGKGLGKMASLELGILAAREAIAGFGGKLAIAAHNGPNATVVAGEEGALEALLALLRSKGVHVKPIGGVSYPSHSPRMADCAAQVERELQGLAPQPADVPIYSTLTGERCDGSEFTAAYWGRQLCETVCFASTVQTSLAAGNRVFLEVGPQPLLSGALGELMREKGVEGVALSSLKKKEDDPVALRLAMAQLYALGSPLRFESLWSGSRPFVELPSYPWDSQVYWYVPSETDEAQRGREGSHVFLQRPLSVAEAPNARYWECGLSATSPYYLAEHRVQGAVVLPGVSYIEFALAGAARVLGEGPKRISDVSFKRMMVLSEEVERTAQLKLAPGAQKQYAWQVSSRPAALAEGSPWVVHAGGSVSALAGAKEAPNEKAWLEAVKARCTQEVSPGELYERAESRGRRFGPTFRGIEKFWRTETEALALLQVPASVAREAGRYQLHPAILESAGHALLLLVDFPRGGLESSDDALFVPIGLKSGQFFPGKATRYYCYARVASPRKPNQRTVVGEMKVVDEDGNVLLTAEGVRWNRLDYDPAKSAIDLEDWFYQVSWEPRARPTTAKHEGPRRGAWLIFADGEGIGVALAKRLQADGEECVVVEPGDSFAQLEPGRFRIHPEDDEDHRRLLDLAFAGAKPCLGVLHLWGLDISEPAGATPQSLGEMITRGSGSVLVISRALSRAPTKSRPRITIVTRGAVATGREEAPVAVGQAPLWGFGRTFMLEEPESMGQLIDLDPVFPAEKAADLLHLELVTGEAEPQIALRGSKRMVARLVRARQGKDALPVHVRSDGAYVISGGLGGLGLTFARWLVEQGARHLVLLSRTLLPPRAQWDAVGAGTPEAAAVAACRELETMGAEVHLGSVDVSEVAAVRGFFEAYHGEGHPPIRGAIHAAGVLRDRTIAELDSRSFYAVMRPKVLGGRNLQRVLEEEPLDFFVLFSSASSVLGSPGQGNYAAANAFLDAFAASLALEEGRPALSLNWGPWSEVGLAATPDRAGRLALKGMGSVDPASGMEAFGQLVRRRAHQMVVVPVDWPALGRAYPWAATSPFLSQLQAQAEARPAARVEVAKLDIAALREATPEVQEKELEAYVRGEVARVMRLEPGRLDADKSLTAMGMDSLTAVELKGRVQGDLGITLTTLQLLAGPSIRQLVSQLRVGLATRTQGGAVQGQTLEALLQEVPLDPTLSPKPGAQPRTDRWNAFLTGATGFVGAFLLRRLLDEGDGQVYCHVRAKDAAEGRERIRRNLATYGLWSDALAERIRPVPGNLEAPLLGLSHPQFEELSEAVDVVFHNGALVNWMMPYAALKGPNVLGTREVLRLASHGRPKPVHYTSTVAAYYYAQGLKRAEVSEDQELELGSEVRMGYGCSKWLGELLVKEAGRRGLPFAIYRAGYVIGDSTTGACSVDDLICRLIKASVLLGKVPEVPLQIDYAPVDFVAGAIVEMAKRGASGRAYHLVNPKPSPWSALGEALHAEGYALQPVSLEAWVEALPTLAGDADLTSVVPLFTEPVPGETLSVGARYLRNALTFDCSQTLAALEGTGVKCLSIPELLGPYIRYFIRTGYMPGPSREAAHGAARARGAR